MFNAKDEHLQDFEEYSDNESSNEKDDFSIDEDIPEEEVGEYQEQNFVLANQGKNNDSIISSITQGTTHLHAGPEKKHMQIFLSCFRKRKGLYQNYRNKLPKKIFI